MDICLPSLLHLIIKQMSDKLDKLLTRPKLNRSEAIIKNRIFSRKKNFRSDIFLKRNNALHQLSSTERALDHKKTIKVDDCRHISAVQKNNFSTSNQFQKSLKVVGVSLSQSATKKHHHWCKYSYFVVLEFTTRWKPLVALKNMQTK